MAQKKILKNWITLTDSTYMWERLENIPAEVLWETAEDISLNNSWNNEMVSAY